MLKVVTASCAAVAALIAATGWTGEAAAQAHDGAYIGLRAIGGMSEVDEITQTGFTGTLVENNVEDPTAALAGVMGYRFRDLPLRAEAEIGHRFRMDLDLRDSGGPGVGYETNLQTTHALLNLAWEIRTDTALTPFIGASVGWARNTAETERTNLTTTAQTSTEESTDNLALGIMAGLGYDFSRTWGAELAYRFLDMGSVETGAQAGGETIEVDSYRSQDLMLTISRRF